jgi:hypothetical protein
MKITKFHTIKLNNKTKIGILIFCVMIIAMVVQSFSLNINNLSNPTNYAEVPPDLEKFTIQKLTTPLSEGENVIIRPTLTHFDSMPQSLFLFTGQDSFAFNDDGVYPDNEAGDHEYAAFFKIDIDGFLVEVENRENELETMEQFIVFEGHEGHFEDSITPFDFTGFAAFQEVEVQANLILAEQCIGSILKQNSLFITHLDVVEDPLRTYNPIDATGAVNGVWTFSYIMSQMANTTGNGVSTNASGISTSDFIKHWLKSYITTVHNPNRIAPDDIKPWRNFILAYLIRPWISKANGRTQLQGVDFDITFENWEEEWNNADDAELLKNAPFKMTAIVNRMDQRNNVAYTNKVLKAGETRFIFTLFNLYEITEDDHDVGEVGEPPRNIIHGGSADFIDWRGMNIIFEFGNVQSNLCDLKNFAQAWVDLSELELGSSSYNAALEDITETVINSNAAVTRPNGSALNQFRTNEKIFSNTGTANIVDVNKWDAASWQFRQFEIDPNTHRLEQVHLTNTPITEDFNKSHNTEVIGTLQREALISDILIRWMYEPENQFLIRKQKHRIPQTYNGYTLLDLAADVDAEYSFYWDLDYLPGFSIPNYNPSIENVTNNAEDRINGKDIRHKLSLNTCQGCHSSETKTLFTMVTPLKVGEAAEYWTSPPHTTTGKLDVRTSGSSFTFGIPKNTGQTVIGNQNTSTIRPFNYPVPTSATREFVSVSPFITGRNYDGTSWDDDENRITKGFDEVDDNQMSGLFYVNDPGNVTDPSNQISGVHNYFGKNDTRHGFNELELRKIDLCRLIRIQCVPTSHVDAMDLLTNLLFVGLVE